MLNNLRLTKFEDIELKDEFFDSLRADYKGFDKWYNTKLKQN